ncbi:putative secreted protein with C-terminal beta-propeller domain [Lentzea atacamensis]|uniref:Putative secreted protein with C-terminal beta-propeller domain n=1 Tax=Lentzea atacamensis TaxID=531938 RepID=A0A316HUL3_9PSEU|nr:beta-propeller domain-containing protein [Lentzea atacamensis]PWK81996.1 putative secreted protein with C-terminal beta-propeller domain [Lentzea atacamensis]
MNGRKLLAGAAVLAVAGVCVSSAVRDETLAPPPVVDYGPVRLVAFDSCDNAVAELRRAMAPYVTAYGIGGGPDIFAAGEGMATDLSAGTPQRSHAEQKAATPPTQQQGHSTTNVHEQGVDEPDIVKTDGKRVVSVADGKLRVVDVASRTITGTVDIGNRHATQLLVAGDRALVIVGHTDAIALERGKPTMPVFDSATEILLVDLKALKQIGSLKTDGFYLDARQIGGTARVVVRSQPRLQWVYPDMTTNEAGALRRNKEILQSEPITSWLPRYELDQNGAKSSGTLVDCPNISHPAVHSATSMLTVLTFELSGQLGTGQPVSIVADGDTVYGTDRNLYIADDHRLLPELPGKPTVQRPITTAIHQFDISQAGPPKHVASGDVNGTLLNQYSLSEHDGVLRVATTTGTEIRCCWRMPGDIAPQQQPLPSESFVTTLRRNGNQLTKEGQIGGLGKGERIYSVRFIGKMGYVVTFRQTDPLYTLDLSDPRQPRVMGELKITGYSAYLHPAGDGKLIGVGQEATDQGRTTGTQVSLFDVSNPAAPQRLAQHHLPGSNSEAQFDPHAFLYWPPDGTLVIPVTQYKTNFEASSLVLRVEGNQIRETGKIVEPASGQNHGGARRTIVIGDQLWSISASGVQINARSGLAQQAWLPF